MYMYHNEPTGKLKTSLRDFSSESLNTDLTRTTDQLEKHPRDPPLNGRSASLRLYSHRHLK